MQENICVTVICSCFNHEKFVNESIKSVLNQPYKNIQLIVIDDFSSDASVSTIQEFINNFPEILFIKNNCNLGITKSFNNAVKQAKGDYIIDLAADDVLLPNCIESQLNAFKTSQFENLAIVYGNAELISEKGTHISYYFDVNSNLKTTSKIIDGDMYSQIISEKTILCSVASMVKKSVFDDLNGYDVNLSYEDFDFWIRVSRNYNIDFIDAVLVQKRIVSNSLHTNFFKPNNKHGYSTNLILKKAFSLNKNKEENRILLKRINFEIKTAIKTKNYSLAIMNIILRIQVGLKSI